MMSPAILKEYLFKEPYGGISLLIIVLPTLLLIWLWRRPSKLYRIRLERIVKKHFEKSRGTQHRLQLAAALAKLNDEINNIKSTISDLNGKIGEINAERDKEIERLVTSYIVHYRMTDIKSIGTKMRDRIISSCFDGTLDSINKAGMLSGIGDKKRADLSCWVSGWKRVLPKLLQHDIDGRREIADKYARMTKELRDRLSSLGPKHAELNMLSREAGAALGELQKPEPKDYYRCFNGVNGASASVQGHIIGLFAIWEEPPEWYRRIMKEYGTEATDVLQT